MEKMRMRMGPRAKLGNERPPREATPRTRSGHRPRWSGIDSGGNRDEDPDEQRCQSERQGVGVALQDEVRDRVVQAERLTEVGVDDSAPVVEVLRVDGCVETIGVAQDGDVGGGGSFAEHLDDRVAGDEVDEKEDDGDYDPQDWEGDEDAANGFG
jgi:hypothetical protein